MQQREDDTPTGLPDEDAPEAGPLGPPDAEPDRDAPAERGAEAMPGIPTEGDPPAAS